MKRIILTAEDEEAIRESLLMLLQDEGYECIAVTDGLEAWQLFKEGKLSVGLLITDLMMPKINGLDLISKVREKYPRLRILVLTSYSNADIVQEALQRGANDYLYKPVNFDELLEMIEALFSTEHA